MASQSIEGLSKIAQAYYTNESERVQILAHNFFNAMDNDGDGYITFAEFNAFMEEIGHTYASSVEWFKWFDKDGNGRLDFMEVMTVFYLTKVGIVFCDKCRCILWQTYFKCVECFENSGNTYDLCTDCYGSKNWDHGHDGRRAQFVDSYALLQGLRILASSQQGRGGSSNSTHYAPTQIQPSTSRGIGSINNWKAALKVLTAGVEITNYACQGGCTIM